MSDKKKNRNVKVTGIVLILLILVTGGLIAFFMLRQEAPIAGGPGRPGGAAPGGSSGSEEAVTYTVRAEETVPVTMEDYLKFNGDVIAENSVDIYPDAAGKLTSLDVSLGSYVRKGQVIAEVDPSLPGQVYVASPVKSTITGTVTDLPFDVGATISSTAVPIATVGNLQDLQIVSYIPEKNMASVALGQTAEVTFEPYGERIFTGTLTEISPVLNRSSRTLEIIISLADSDNVIKSGMFGSVKLITRLKEGVFSLPAESILDTSEGSFVYVVSPDNTAHQQFIETGLEIDGMVEILSGIEQGDLVVTRGISMLREGFSVRIAQ